MIVVLIYLINILLVKNTETTKTLAKSSDSPTIIFSDKEESIKFLKDNLSGERFSDIAYNTKNDENLFYLYFCMDKDTVKSNFEKLTETFSRCISNIYVVKDHAWALHFVSYSHYLTTETEVETLNILHNIIFKMNEFKGKIINPVNSNEDTHNVTENELIRFINACAEDYIRNDGKKPNILRIMNYIEDNKIGEDYKAVYILILKKLEGRQDILKELPEIATVITYLFLCLSDKSISGKTPDIPLENTHSKITTPRILPTQLCLLYIAVGIFDLRKKNWKNRRTKILFILHKICMLHGTSDSTITFYKNIFSFIYDSKNKAYISNKGTIDLEKLRRYLYFCCFYNPDYIALINERIYGMDYEYKKQVLEKEATYDLISDFGSLSGFILTIKKKV